MAQHTPSLLAISGLTKRYATGDLALDQVNLAVPPGQVMALIGPSGAGKSTLIRCVNRLVEPTSGKVVLDGTELTTLSRGALRRARRRMGMIFQEYALVERLTVMENVLSGALGRLRGPRFGVSAYPKQLRREALELLDRVGLGDRAFQRTDTLSGDQQQRCAIARTILQRPRIVLADEPVASLDPEISGQVMDVLMRICTEEGLTVLCSLHQVDLALGWADRLVGLRDGQLVLDKPAAGLSTDEVMAVYRRLDPSGEKLAEYAESAPAGAASGSGH